MQMAHYHTHIHAQEPGWLNGRLGDRKGVFPSNFTAPYNDGVQRF